MFLFEKIDISHILRFFFFFFLWLYLQHMEVTWPGTESKPQLQHTLQPKSLQLDSKPTACYKGNSIALDF